LKISLQIQFSDVCVKLKIIKQYFALNLIEMKAVLKPLFDRRFSGAVPIVGA
jgi:hypothetical protein